MADVQEQVIRMILARVIKQNSRRAGINPEVYTFIKLNFLGFLSKAAELFDHILSPPGSFYTNLSVKRVCAVKERISSVDD